MSLRLRLRLVLSTILGALLVVTAGSALQFREAATLAEDIVSRDVELLVAAGEMQRLLAAPERGQGFEEAFRAQVDVVQAAQTTSDEQATAAALVDAFDTWLAADPSARDEAAMREGVSAVLTLASAQANDTVTRIGTEATTAAIGLGVLGAAVLVIGAWLSRVVRLSLLDRLVAVEQAADAVRRGEFTRRLGPSGDDELGKVAEALDSVLDLRDRAESAMQGRNRELRAMLVALLKRWPRPAAITGVDGEIIVSTLSPEQEEALRSVTAQLRMAARTLLSRKFVSAAELTTDLRVDDTHAFAIKALALGEQRIVGWVADSIPAKSGAA